MLPTTRLRHLPTIALAATLALVCFAWPGLALAQEKDLFTRSLEYGPIAGGGAAFLGGLLACLTPCVYPMIAVTVSIFGAREATSRRQAMLLSTSFVLGIVVLFTTMLVIAALTGGVMGSVLSNKWVLIGISLVFVALSLSMFGAFEMTLPDSVMQRLAGVGGIGYGGAFMLGLVSGLVAAPCTGPILTAILLWIAQTKSIALGAVVGTLFSLGLGLPFWIVGTFAVALPKGGKWMVSVKSFFGVVILVFAFKNVIPAFPVLGSFAQPTGQFLAITAGVVVVGLLLGAIHLSWDDGGALVKIRKGLGIAVTVVGAFLFWVSYDTPKAQLTWLHEEPVAVDKAKAEKRPLMVDFTAEWCAACKRMSKETFSDPRVMEKAGGFVAVKIDATDDEDPQIEAVKGKYKVVGLPTLVIYDSTGAERQRFNDFVGPDDFVKALDGIN